jgi:hypothetical protein
MQLGLQIVERLEIQTDHDCHSKGFVLPYLTQNVRTSDVVTWGAAPDLIDDIEGDRFFIYNREAATGDTPERNAGMRTLETAPQAGVDADHAANSGFTDHHDVAQSALPFVLPQKRIKAAAYSAEPGERGRRTGRQRCYPFLSYLNDTLTFAR